MKRRHRRGLTLLEMLVVVTTLTMIASTAGVLLTTALRSSRETTSALARHRALAQLDRALRRDARAASSAALADEALQLKRGKKVIVYEAQASGIERRELDAEGEVLRRELFRLDAPIEMHFSLSSDALQTVTLSFAPSPNRAAASEGWRSIRTVAVVGSDQRYSKKGTP